MTDPFIISVIVAAFVIAAVWLTINNCADADIHGERAWWSKALFRAKQRIEYREYCRDLERLKAQAATPEYAAQREE